MIQFFDNMLIKILKYLFIHKKINLLNTLNSNNHLLDKFKIKGSKENLSWISPVERLRVIHEIVVLFVQEQKVFSRNVSSHQQMGGYEMRSEIFNFCTYVCIFFKNWLISFLNLACNIQQMTWHIPDGNCFTIVTIETKN